ncbi:unnamed protein product [Musa acuminata subsp. malaccensis]|uniref:(wild Malaysian banana) hypothetical protein n=1 Tax=Musa acuminata subsp. malaccensis TaxID=214687 RepID=A0A804HX80_MUSAM|nr:PREDICTED: uncharacterized protein LOC103972897 isoform X1 [Musa acuminata subsp. malaccensis]CAG1860353.1 unnamed protein product [Musa acuminata subsp. malaccensis]
MKVRRYLPLSGVSIPHLILISSLIFSSIPGSLSSKAITLRSIQIYNTHEFLGPHPTIYFYCKGENKTILPDVKEKHFSYIFYGEESWQPLTELPGKKCKRCGLYEFDTIKSDDVFDEWDLCLDDFINGISIHYKAKQFNATLLCEDCQVATDSAQTSTSSDGSANKKIDLILVVVISVLVSIMATIVTVGAYKYWQKRKREKDQAHFLKLFEEGDDIEDELGLSM